MELQILQKFAISLILGALVGVERQFSKTDDQVSLSAIGLRTFIFLSLLGTTSALIADKVGALFFGIAFAGVFTMIGIGYIVVTRRSQDVGMTTEASALLVFMIGSLVWWDMRELAIALAVAVTVFLSLKETLHEWAHRIEREDIFAALKFAIITFIILPILPNKVYGPFNAFNPHEIWLIVVLISGIGFVGYILLKILGPTRGIGLVGLLGGLVSSTAVTLSFSRRSKQEPTLFSAFALAIVLASTIMFPRILFEIWVINPKLMPSLIPPIAILTATGAVFSLWYYLRARRKLRTEPVKFRNPLDFSMAVKFGLLYAIILFAAQIARHYAGEGGLMAVSVLSGVTHIDAIVLSIARMAKLELDAHTATRAIVLATLSNTLFKAILIWILGTPLLRWWVVGALGTILGTGIIIWLIPGIL
jgi:uncharacterized membrane protein (DUF4010 family)